MSVSTHSVTSYAETANFKSLRRSAVVRAGTYLYEGQHLVTGWHRHDVHQIEYAVGGVVDVETSTSHFLLPPQQAVFIPAGLHHQATMNSNVRSIAVMFDPELVQYDGTDAAVLDVSPLIREMIVHAQRWPIGRLSNEVRAERFFQALGDLVVEAVGLAHPMFSLPTSKHSVVSEAMTYTRENLETVSAARVSRAVAVSERTLRRLFREETGSSWRTYLLHARMLKAMALLATPTQSVQETAHTVGFRNVSSFARAFVEYCGTSPSEYRKHSAAQTF